MKRARDFIVSSMISGLLVLVPVYLALIVLLKAIKTVGGLVRPIAVLFPDWLPREDLLALLVVLALCVALGAAVRARAGQAIRERIERSLFERIPGYALFRSLTQHEEALVPAS